MRYEKATFKVVDLVCMVDFYVDLNFVCSLLKAWESTL